MRILSCRIEMSEGSFSHWLILAPISCDGRERLSFLDKKRSEALSASSESYSSPRLDGEGGWGGPPPPSARGDGCQNKPLRSCRIAFQNIHSSTHRSNHTQQKGKMRKLTLSAALFESKNGLIHWTGTNRGACKEIQSFLSFFFFSETKASANPGGCFFETRFSTSERVQVQAPKNTDHRFLMSVDFNYHDFGEGNIWILKTTWRLSEEQLTPW